MAQPHRQQQQASGWGGGANAWPAQQSSSSSAHSRQQHRPGRLLLGDIQALQQQQQQQQQPWRWPPGGGRQCSANEVACIASAADPTSSSNNTASETPPDLFPLDTQHKQHKQQQQQQSGLPFWKGLQQRQAQDDVVLSTPSSQQHPQQQQLRVRHTLDPQQQQQQQQQQQYYQAQPQHKQQPQQQQPATLFQPRPLGSIGPQFASATLSGNGSSGSGSDSPTALKAVGRVFGNGEICKLLGFVGAQLLMHAAHIQHSMHQLHQRQQGLSPDADLQQQQQQGPGFGMGGWRLRMPWQRQEGAAGGGEGGAGGSSAGGGARGNAAWQAGEAAKQWVARGIVAERNIELREALACYTNAVTLEPGNREYLCRVAKQWSDLTYEEGATVEQIQEVNAKAMEYAERVVAMAPKSPDGYLASCVSKGRLALFSDNKTKVRLAKEAQEAARTAVELDPRNDLAHHLMGRWHFEMAQINFVLRQLIRIVYGAALNPGTFEEALTEFQHAVAINPNKLIHRVELGRTHLRLGHKADAYQHLLASMELEVEDVNAKLQKEDAELLLAKLQAELKGRTELPASWGGFTTPGLAQIEAAAGPDGSSSSVSSSSSTRVVEEVDDEAGGAGGNSSSSAGSGGIGGAAGV